MILWQHWSKQDTLCIVQTASKNSNFTDVHSLLYVSWTTVWVPTTFTVLPWL